MTEFQMGELIPLAEFALVESPFAADRQATDTISVQIMRPGVFTEKHGRQVTITEADMDAYVANFESGVAGQEVPLFQGHPVADVRAEAPAVAWYKRVYSQVVDGIKTLWADIQLTELGKTLLEGNLYKYISPSLDLEAKVVRGGGFVNLPAIKGMAAMELSAHLQEVTMEQSLYEQLLGVLAGWKAALAGTKPAAEASQEEQTTEEVTNEMTDEERKALEAKIRQDIEAEFAEKAQTEAEMTERIRVDVRAQVEAEFAEKVKRQAELSEFVKEVGEAGLSTPPDEVAAALLLLNDEQLAAIKPLLTAKVVDFSEQGHTGAGTKVQQVPDAMAMALREFVKGKKEVAQAVDSFCKANGLDATLYDLSEFLPKA